MEQRMDSWQEYGARKRSAGLKQYSIVGAGLLTSTQREAFVLDFIKDNNANRLHNSRTRHLRHITKLVPDERRKACCGNR